jgi:hypothetical protein
VTRTGLLFSIPAMLELIGNNAMDQIALVFAVIGMFVVPATWLLLLFVK